MNMISAPRILSVVAVVGLLDGSAVNTLPSPFSCCPDATLTYEPHCETTFILNDTDRLTFRRIIVKNNAKKRRLYEAFIETLPLLTSLELSERMKVVDVISTNVYNDSQQIIAQGDLADSFYIVESGQVRITMKRSRTKKDQEDEEVDIAMCSRGQYFGELALVTNKPRAASAYAVGRVKCLVIDVQAFERLLGPCMDIMKRNIANYEEQLVALFGSSTEIEQQSA
ncbi:hypothetical protein JOQ06_026292 [Pogonophryne albipinna]|uniref:Cyclic nucleotide-binding domain-containing protein n=1 Tax=Pogonophryne albipinna TaxID=1090488 RepID=A0AAD6A5Q7_9TELE|nr:hypothetical protein JOQ06_026292 [Pogonophryne albipinna]